MARPQSSDLKAAIKLLFIAVWFALGYGPLWLSYKLGKTRLRDRIMQFAAAGVLRVVGVQVEVTGQVAEERPLLLVSNHVSYLDVYILNASAPLHFTPKTEIASWPFLGSITRMSGAVFVDRKPGKLAQAQENIEKSLAGGNVVCLFPEATTGNGIHTLPFKSGFFSLAEKPIAGRELTVQPAAIVYRSLYRLPIDTTQWPAIAWYGDMLLLPHLWNLLKMAPLEAQLVFAPPTTFAAHGDRKILAAHCHKTISDIIQSRRGESRQLPLKPIAFKPGLLRLKP